MTGRLFVYGTLMPGQPRWPLLKPLSAPARPDRAEAPGHLYRTPYGWPAAVFDPAASSSVPGLVVTLRDPTAAFPVLDEIEGTSAGLFRRQLITSTAGQCWAYHWPGQTSGFQPIAAWPGG
jgi:gamma-glutamylcyclotransferase (GGCT)/AIG2-like uncharacterized protein YtfP